MKNLLNSMRKQGGKPIITLYAAILQEVKNLQNLAGKMVEKNLILIGDRDKTSESKA